MTDRHHGYIVTLEKDVREDDAEDIITAIGMVRGVASCKPLVRDHNQHIADERARREIWNKVLDVIHPEWREK